MSRVYLQEIPNAPQRLADPAVMSGGPSAPDLGGVTQTLLQSGIQQGAFDGPAEGVQRVAESVKGLARPLAAAALDWAQMKSDANDAINKGQRQALRTEWYSNLTAQTQGLPESEWVPQFEKALPKLNEALAKYPLSRRASPEEDGYQLNWVAERKGSLHIAATRQAFEKGMVTLVGGYQQAIAQGDIEGAKRLGDQLEAGRFWSPEQRKLEDQKAGDTLKLNAFSYLLQNNPRRLRSELDAAKADGTLAQKFAPLSPEQIVSLDAQVDHGVAGVNAREYFTAQKEIGDGIIRSGDDVEKRYGSLPKQTRDLVVRNLASDRPFDNAKDGPTLARVQVGVLTYDPRNDPGQSGLRGIQEEISRLPRKQQMEMINSLQKVWTAGFVEGRPRTASEIQLSRKLTEFQEAANRGDYGPTGRDPADQHLVTDARASADFANRCFFVQQKYIAFAQQHPNANPQDWDKMSSALLVKDATDQARKAYAPPVPPSQPPSLGHQRIPVDQLRKQEQLRREQHFGQKPAQDPKAQAARDRADQVINSTPAKL